MVPDGSLGFGRVGGWDCLLRLGGRLEGEVQVVGELLVLLGLLVVGELEVVSGLVCHCSYSGYLSSDCLMYDCLAGELVGRIEEPLIDQPQALLLGCYHED